MSERNQILPELVLMAWTSYQTSGGSREAARRRVVSVCAARAGIMADPLRSLPANQCELIGCAFAEAIMEFVDLASQVRPKLTPRQRIQIQESVLRNLRSQGPLGRMCAYNAGLFLDNLLPNQPNRPLA